MLLVESFFLAFTKQLQIFRVRQKFLDTKISVDIVVIKK